MANENSYWCMHVATQPHQNVTYFVELPFYPFPLDKVVIQSASTSDSKLSKLPQKSQERGNISFFSLQIKRIVVSLSIVSRIFGEEGVLL